MLFWFWGSWKRADDLTSWPRGLARFGLTRFTSHRDSQGQRAHSRAWAEGDERFGVGDERGASATPHSIAERDPDLHF